MQSENETEVQAVRQLRRHLAKGEQTIEHVQHRVCWRQLPLLKSTQGLLLFLTVSQFGQGVERSIHSNSHLDRHFVNHVSRLCVSIDKVPTRGMPGYNSRSLADS